jgi:hypothetical protein
MTLFCLNTPIPDGAHLDGSKQDKGSMVCYENAFMTSAPFE